MIKNILLFFTLLIYSISFSQEKSIHELMASPNPFTDSTNITFHSLSKQQISINIKNILGNIIFSKNIEAIKGKNTFPFNRNKLRTGMYIYAIQSNTEFISKRFVIK